MKKVDTKVDSIRSWVIKCPQFKLVYRTSERYC